MIVPGFQAAAVEAGLKKAGGLDLALIVADSPAAAAGVFTKNRVKAWPVLLCQERLRRGRAQAILINSGNANACNGPRGLADAREAARVCGDLLNLPEESVLPASTGVIGQPLPLDRIKEAIPRLVARLRPGGLGDVAQAIMTTDTRIKTAYIKGKVGAREVTVAGLAKGSGMIHPDMATMLAFIFTDAAAAPQLLKRLLKEALPFSFNRITVDGDTSTNDTILLLASGVAGNSLLKGKESGAAQLKEYVTQVMADLAQQVVADGEGARHVYRVSVQGAASPTDALKAARTVALSPLVKTAMAGADVNWGRILCALGRSGARFDPERVEIAYGDQAVAQEGRGLGEAAEAAAQKIILTGSFTLNIKLNAGAYSDYYDTCDLTEDYIKINASYRS